jgi:hypothetical protein
LTLCFFSSGKYLLERLALYIKTPTTATTTTTTTTKNQGGLVNEYEVMAILKNLKLLFKLLGPSIEETEIKDLVSQREKRRKST